MRELWLTVAAAGVGTFLLRYSFLALFERVEEVPPRLLRGLRYVPAAVLAALVVPAIVTADGTTLTVAPDRIAAAAIAGVVAWRTESVLWTIVTGLVALTLISQGATLIA